MKNKFIILTIAGLLLASSAACGNEKAPNADQNTSDEVADNQNQQEQDQDSQGTSDTIQGDIEKNNENDGTEAQKMQVITKVEISHSGICLITRLNSAVVQAAGLPILKLNKMVLSRETTMTRRWGIPEMTMRMEQCIFAAFQENLRI